MSNKNKTMKNVYDNTLLYLKPSVLCIFFVYVKCFITNKL
jgi:hypothetical protein